MFDKRSTRRRLMLECLERRHLLAADLWFPGYDFGPDAGEIDMEAEMADLQRVLGSGAELSVQVINLRTNSPVTEVNVGDVILVRPWMSGSPQDGVASHLLSIILKSRATVAYETSQFTHLERPFGLHPDGDLPAVVNSAGSIWLIADEVGTGTLITVSDAAPEGMTAANPDALTVVLSRTTKAAALAAYLSDELQHAELNLTVVNAGQRPVAHHDSYELDVPSEYVANLDLTLTVSAADGVLANDISPTDSPLRALLVDRPKHGRVELNTDGSFVYEASRDRGLNGSDTFAYVAIGDEGTSQPRTVTIYGSHPPILDVDVRVVSADGEPLSSVRIGERFFVEVIASANDSSARWRPITGNLNFESRVVAPVAVEFNAEFNKPHLYTETEDGKLVLLTRVIPSTATVHEDSIQVNVPGLTLEKVTNTEKVVLRSEFTAQAAGELEFAFSDFSAGLADHLVTVGSTTLRVEPGSPWQNPVQPLDVNGDGIISPLDVLLGINRLNSAGAMSLSAEGPITDAEAEGPVTDAEDILFFDTNGDGHHSPLDILLLLNRLNESAHAEGPAAALFVPVAITVRSMPQPESRGITQPDATAVVPTETFPWPVVQHDTERPELEMGSWPSDDAAELLDLLAEDVFSAA